MPRLLQIGLGWGLALGIAGSIMVVVYFAAPPYIKQKLELQRRVQQAEQDLALDKKRHEQELQLEAQQNAQRLAYEKQRQIIYDEQRLTLEQQRNQQNIEHEKLKTEQAIELEEKQRKMRSKYE